MPMTLTLRIVTVLIVVLGTMVTRFLPFLLFPSSRTPPRAIRYLGGVLPCAVMGLLIVYCLKGVHVLSGSHGLPELIAIVSVALLHLWKRNTLLSIGAGTVIYMMLVQFVFR